MNMLQRLNKIKDWKEDFNLENGKYLNKCIKCNTVFLGHKRRWICKECFEKESNRLGDKR